MIQIENKKDCCGCFACVNICPKKCIGMRFDAEGFLYPAVDKQDCIDCRICEMICPVKKDLQPTVISRAYGGYSKNESIRKESSSGGIFSVMADAVIENDGAVFGAAYSEDFLSVHHECALRKEDLAKFRTSKYVQSSTDDAFSKAKALLDTGKTVLYTGTPCQIAGLRSYFKKEYDNLITQDVICHGVPSPLIWRDYILYRETKARAKVRHVTVRSKKYGWRSYSFLLCAENGKKYVSRCADDIYLRGFLQDIYLRPSCYDCKFRSGKSGSDITIADFWGVENALPELNDDRGVSLILIHSEKGKAFFDQIRQSLIVKETDSSQALKGNPAYYRSPSIPDQRDEFWAYATENGTMRALEKYAGKPWWKIGVAKVKRRIRKDAKRILRR